MCIRDRRYSDSIKIHLPKLVENDLRPISVTDTLSKIFESFLGGRVLEAVSRQLETIVAG